MVLSPGMLVARVFSAAVWGVDAFAVEVEANCTFGSPVVVVVGLPDTAVKESRDRVKTAIENSGFRHPYGRTTINLAPADVKKEGPAPGGRVFGRQTGDRAIAAGLFRELMKIGRKRSLSRPPEVRQMTTDYLDGNGSGLQIDWIANKLGLEPTKLQVECCKEGNWTIWPIELFENSHYRTA